MYKKIVGLEQTEQNGAEWSKSNDRFSFCDANPCSTKKGVLTRPLDSMKD